MTVKLLILVTALALIVRTRVALLPGWVVPVPALFLAVALTAVGALAALLVLRFRTESAPAPSVPAAPPAPRVIKGEVTQ
jgi:hypothetical protein